MKINIDNYRKITSEIDYMYREEDLIKTHKGLIGKSCKCDYFEIKDCGVEFINSFLLRDFGRTIVYKYSNGAEKFIKSKYLSDYFKTSISKLLLDEVNESLKKVDSFHDKLAVITMKNETQEIFHTLSILKSDKMINDMSEEEIGEIVTLIRKCYNKSTAKSKDANVSKCFTSLLYKLDGPGVVAFIKNNMDKGDLARHILSTSGLSDRASYYSGRGVNYRDLNEQNLAAIFNKLLKLDESYAMNFVQMIQKMKTLGATEFINTFMNFAWNDFKSNTQDIEDSNVSLDGVYGGNRDMVALASIFEVNGRKNDKSYQIKASEQMKRDFMYSIEPSLKKINPNYCNSQDYKLLYSHYPFTDIYKWKH